jgi:PTH1 family peptidyl-tRNA hydrolase
MLIAGLGNPGPKYAHTRHNIGFFVVDHMVNAGGETWTERREYAQARSSLSGERVTLLKPYTFMNRSGQVVAERARFYDQLEGDLVVVHDDLDLPLGTIRIKKGGSTAGHNGLRSIESDLGSNNFVRIRVGIGRPEHKSQVKSYVLQPFGSDEQKHMETVIEGAAEAITLYLNEGLKPAQNAIHGKDFLAA